MRIKYQKGASIYIAVILMAVLLGIAAGASSILVGQLNILRGIGQSVVAFSAAEAGIERIMMIDSCTLIQDEESRMDCLYAATSNPSFSHGSCNGDEGPDDPVECIRRAIEAVPASARELQNDASYDLEVALSGAGSCVSDNYCAASTGDFHGSKRKVEVAR
ncbi:MAG: hypothetical protein Q8P39_02925 [Candidatus Yanofskybacteria bacterium]|nr:hypothetical protein [Candidatus Yanofskybacteria bacterium]